MNCICCNNKMKDGLSDWHFQCEFCGYESAKLIQSINRSISCIDEDCRENGLRDLRQKNFKAIVDLIKKEVLSENRKKLLEIGCGHGWFIEIAEEYFDCTGIEPDNEVCERAKNRGVIFRKGFFPDVLLENEIFDIIVFNDVLEHIQELEKSFCSINKHLNKNGVLSINIPLSCGVFYKISKFLIGLGFKDSFNRMWQLGFPSPHLHYFNDKNLEMLFNKYEFELFSVKELSSITLKGLYNRVSTAKQRVIFNYAVFIMLCLSMPIVNLFKSDTAVFLFRKRS